MHRSQSAISIKLYCNFAEIKLSSYFLDFLLSQWNSFEWQLFQRFPEMLSLRKHGQIYSYRCYKPHTQMKKISVTCGRIIITKRHTNFEILLTWFLTGVSLVSIIIVFCYFPLFCCTNSATLILTLTLLILSTGQ